MRGTERVIEQLNEALECELSAIVQHIVHAETIHISGNRRHGLYIKKLAIEEMLHVRVLIARILVLEGLPRVDAPPMPRIGGSFLAQLENDLTAERQAVDQYYSAAAICASAGDTVSQTLLEGIVKNKETHADYLVAELSVHAVAGLENGATQRIHSVPDSKQNGSVSYPPSIGAGRELQTAPRKRTV
jgi:bacterioferritin